MIATSKYNALTVKGEQRFWKGLTFLASYAFQKSTDLNSEFGGTSPQDNQNIRASMGPSGFDQTHVFNTGYSWEIPSGWVTGSNQAHSRRLANQRYLDPRDGPAG